MLAPRLTTILPAMTLAEAIKTTRLHRVAGRTGDRTARVTVYPASVSIDAWRSGSNIPPSRARVWASPRHVRDVFTLPCVEICVPALPVLQLPSRDCAGWQSRGTWAWLLPSES
jgi:hypothetical protein